MIPTPALDKFNEEMRKRYGITPEQSLREAERLRHYARINEASALGEAEDHGRLKGMLAAMIKRIQEERLEGSQEGKVEKTLKALLVELQEEWAEYMRQYEPYTKK